MADESKSRYSIAEQLRVFAGRQAFDEERELVYRAAETIDNLAKAYVAERDALLAIRSERGRSYEDGLEDAAAWVRKQSEPWDADMMLAALYEAAHSRTDER